MKHTVYTASPSVIQPEIGEIMRYMGVGTPDAQLVGLITDCITEMKMLISPKAVYVSSSVSVVGIETELEFMSMVSADLAAFLRDADEAYVFVATLGTRVDVAVNKYLRVQPSRGIVMNAVAIAMIECFCDRLNGHLLGTDISSSRFSPGYGDLPLEYQRELLTGLDAERKIGVTLTDACLMLPTKSVSAIVGVKQIRR